MSVFYKTNSRILMNTLISDSAASNVWLYQMFKLNEMLIINRPSSTETMFFEIDLILRAVLSVRVE